MMWCGVEVDTILNAELLRDGNRLTHQDPKGEYLDKLSWDHWLSISKEEIRKREWKGGLEEEKLKKKSWTEANFRKAALNVLIA